MTFLKLNIMIAGPHYKVHCTEDSLRVDVVKHEDVSAIYLQHLKDYPGESSSPVHTPILTIVHPQTLHVSQSWWEVERLSCSVWTTSTSAW